MATKAHQQRSYASSLSRFPDSWRRLMGNKTFKLLLDWRSYAHKNATKPQDTIVKAFTLNYEKSPRTGGSNRSRTGRRGGRQQEEMDVDKEAETRPTGDGSE